MLADLGTEVLNVLEGVELGNLVCNVCELIEHGVCSLSGWRSTRLREVEAEALCCR